MNTTFFIQPVDPRFQGERERTFSLLEKAVPFADWLEVGSTAVAGVIGKGDLDVLVRCDEQQFPLLLWQLDRCFVRNPDQFSSSIYQAYTLPSPLDLALQCTVQGGPHDNFHLFLDALRQSPELVSAYNELKRRYHGQPMDDYRTAKQAFIEAAIAG